MIRTIWHIITIAVLVLAMPLAFLTATDAYAAKDYSQYVNMVQEAGGVYKTGEASKIGNLYLSSTDGEVMNAGTDNRTYLSFDIDPMAASCTAQVTNPALPAPVTARLVDPQATTPARSCRAWRRIMANARGQPSN